VGSAEENPLVCASVGSAYLLAQTRMPRGHRADGDSSDEEDKPRGTEYYAGGEKRCATKNDLMQKFSA
jgi:hypothetical protein